MDKQQALQFFWSQFGVSAYDESDVPDDADIDAGYITYQKIEGEFESPVFPSASIWHRSTSWKKTEKIKNSINETLSRGGWIQKIEGGRVWIQRGSPFAQEMAEEDRSIRRYVINVSIEFMTE